MNLSELEKIVSDAGINICPICGTPFDKYHKRQKTCGTEECKKEWAKQRSRKWYEKFKERDVDEYRKYHREAQKKHRDKKRRLMERDEQLEDIQKRWEKVKAFDDYVSDNGINYGKLQMEKTLASVPKIDTTIGGKPSDKLHSKDDESRG
jgi:DNA repair exonuclease SbcCD ATPase subunit